MLQDGYATKVMRWPTAYRFSADRAILKNREEGGWQCLTKETTGSNIKKLMKCWCRAEDWHYRNCLPLQTCHWKGFSTMCQWNQASPKHAQRRFHTISM